MGRPIHLVDLGRLGREAEKKIQRHRMLRRVEEEREIVGTGHLCEEKDLSRRSLEAEEEESKVVEQKEEKEEVDRSKGREGSLVDLE